MLRRTADFAIRRRRLVLIAAAVAFVLSGALGGGVAKELSSGGFQDPGAESTDAEDFLLERFGAGTPNFILLVTSPEGTTVDSPEVARAGAALTEQLAAEDDLTNVISYWSAGSAPPLRSDDSTRGLVFGRIEGSDDHMIDRVEELRPEFEGEFEGVDVALGGFGPIFEEVSDTIERDLVRAESIALPVTLLLLLLVFGSVVAASLPLVIGAMSIVGTFLLLLIVNKFTEVSVFSLNLTTGMGLGLAVDYSLFVVSRYREELRAGHEPHEAVRRTVQTAGRTVAFSALTVAASLVALIIFPLAFLRSFAYAGIGVAALAGIYAVVVLPAMLAALGHRVDSLTFWKRSTNPPEEGFWHNTAVRVMRKPIPYVTVALMLLLLLGSPVLRLNLGLPDDRVVPPGTKARDVGDIIRQEFSSEDAGAAPVVAAGIGDPVERAGEIREYAGRLSQLEGVSRVDAITGTYVGGQQVIDGATSPIYARFAAEDATFLNVVPAVEPLSDEGEHLVRDIRELDAPFEVIVGGQSAQLVDAKHTLNSLLPWAMAIIAVITFALLFLMFGSVVVPLKALVLNVLSLSATFGAMVWIFQDGHLSDALGFTPTGSLVATTPILMFCVAFGLSMDYEVFLLSRIKEEHDRTGDNLQSVAVGLEKTGRIVTAAAVTISVVFLAFATSDVSFIQLFGIGLALAVLMDAFVIRGTLVPGFMRLAGEANWWAPGPMRRFHQRWGISEHVELDGPPAPVAPRPVPVPERHVNGRPRRTEPLRAAGRVAATNGDREHANV